MYGYRFVFQTMSSKYVGGANCTHCKPHSLEIIHRVKNKVIQGYNIKKIVVTVVANVPFFFFFFNGGFHKPSPQLLYLHCLVYLCTTSNAGLHVTSNIKRIEVN